MLQMSFPPSVTLDKESKKSPGQSRGSSFGARSGLITHSIAAVASRLFVCSRRCLFCSRHPDPELVEGEGSRRPRFATTARTFQRPTPPSLPLPVLPEPPKKSVMLPVLPEPSKKSIMLPEPPKRSVILSGAFDSLTVKTRSRRTPASPRERSDPSAFPQ